MIRKFTSKTQQSGQKGEDEASVFLMKQGFEIVERNFHSRNGEIDIIARKNNKYYFFEVKAGMQGSWFNPAENLTPGKLWKFNRAVQYYALIKRIKNYSVQGIIILLPQSEKDQPKIDILDLT